MTIRLDFIDPISAALGERAQREAARADVQPSVREAELLRLIAGYRTFAARVVQRLRARQRARASQRYRETALDECAIDDLHAHDALALRAIGPLPDRDLFIHPRFLRASWPVVDYTPEVSS